MVSKNIFFHLGTPIVLLAWGTMLIPKTPPLKGKENGPVIIYSPPEVLGTHTKFSQDTTHKKIGIPFQTIVKFDPDKDACSDPDIKQEGVDGEKLITTKMVYYNGEKFDEEIEDVTISQPTNKIILKGVNKIPKVLNTPEGAISYWCKLENVLATSYDSTCDGCDTVTAIGMKQGFGVVAVDPKVIPLRTNLYIPGYGRAVAGDTGGLIKGKHIDLGYDSLMGQWSRRYVDVYIMN